MSVLKKTLLLCLFASISLVSKAEQGTKALTSFSLNASPAYQVTPGKIKNTAVVFSASYHGEVFCHTQGGSLIWSAKAGEGFPFDIKSVDLDFDGKDEVLIASSDGALYAFNDCGRLLWTFKREGPLYQVEAVVEDGVVIILTGGIERTLFSLNAKGQVMNQFASNGVIRLVEAGKILGNGKLQVAVGTAESALLGRFTINLLEAATLKPVWIENTSNLPGLGNRGRFFSMEVFDINKDGKDEIVLGHDFAYPNWMTVIDGDKSIKRIELSKNPGSKTYRMVLLRHIKSKTLNDEYMLNHFGDEIIQFDLDGKVRNIIKFKYSFTNSAFDPETNTLFLSSELSGGDGIYAIRLDHPNWIAELKAFKPVGKMKKLEANLKLLSEQVEKYKPVSYQPEVEKTMVSVVEPYANIIENYLSKATYEQVEFARYFPVSENYDRSALKFGYDTKRDRRRDYKQTSEDIINIAREHEQKNEHFILWAGHGNDPFFMSLTTMEGVLKAAPNTFKGFVYAELEDVDARMQYVIETHILPLAELCLKYGKKKIFLRNKNIFWQGSVYVDFWMKALRNERYRDVFVPSMEQTNSRTQSLSLYARMGLWMTGVFSSFSDRAVTDNPNYTRLWEWCSTERLSHFIRAAAIGRTLGANDFLIQIHTNNKEDMIPLYLMLEKGILLRPTPENLVSVPDVAIGIKSPPDMDYIEHGINGNAINKYKPVDYKMVSDKLDCFWGGAIIPEWDIEYYAFNAKRRMSNFIAQAPYGNIAVIPADTDLSKHKMFKKVLVTDGKNWIDDKGKIHSPEAYKPTVLAEISAAAKRLPILVTGEVSWSAIKIDEKHYRVTLIDPGYLDPADRDAVININGLQVIEATDILSQEVIPVHGNQIALTVPMGILRVIDLKVK